MVPPPFFFERTVMAKKQKDPKDREHVWEHDSSHPFPQPEASVQPDDYPHQIPRHVHHPEKGSKIVRTVDECEKALNDEGYQLLP